MMPILVKPDDVRSTTKAKVRQIYTATTNNNKLNKPSKETNTQVRVSRKAKNK